MITARGVLETSFLAGLDDRLAEALVADATRVEVPARRVLYSPARAGAEAPRLVLVEQGLLRIAAVAGGRQLTVRYVRPGEAVGVALLFSRAPPATVESLAPSALWLLDAARVGALARAEAAVAWRVAQENARLLEEAYDELVAVTFGSVHRRLARHLLELAAGHEDLVARATQQQLAHAVGSVREVVARELKRLRDAGAVEVTAQGVKLLDPVRLLDADAPDAP